MWKNTVESGRPWIASCIPKATKTISEYVTPIAFLLQQWLKKTCLIVTLQVKCLPCSYVKLPIRPSYWFLRNERTWMSNVCNMLSFLCRHNHLPQHACIHNEWMGCLVVPSLSRCCRSTEEADLVSRQLSENNFYGSGLTLLQRKMHLSVAVRMAK
jgi:hypothetical protein